MTYTQRETERLYETARKKYANAVMENGKLRAKLAALQTELQLIADQGCESFCDGITCRDTTRTKIAECGADRWCNPCIASAALAESEGRTHEPD